MKHDLFAADVGDRVFYPGVGAIHLTRLFPSSIDLTITDPAYASLERHRAKGTTTRLKDSSASSNPWFATVDYEYLEHWLHHLYVAHKVQTHAYIFCDEPTADVMKAAARRIGWWVWKTLVWVKTTTDPKVKASLVEGDEPRLQAGMGYHWRAANERILFLEKRTVRQRDEWTPMIDPVGNGRQLNHRGWEDVLFAARVSGYPTQKPVSLIRRLIANSSDRGDVVFDPFAGSGSTGVAATMENRRVLMGDVSPASEEYIRARWDQNHPLEIRSLSHVS